MQVFIPLFFEFPLVKNVKNSFASSFLGDFASWWPIFAGVKGQYAKGRLDFLRRKSNLPFLLLLLILSSRRYMALASEPERISLFWRVTGSCVALLLCLPAVFLITFLALWLTLPPLLSFGEMFRAVSS